MEDNNKKQIIIEVDEEFLNILKRLEEKVKHSTWEGLEKVSYKSLTKILAKKINALKIV